MAARDGMQGFASAGLLALVVTVLRETEPHLLAPGIAPVDPMRGAKIEPGAKRAVIEHAYRLGGAGALLRIGRHLGRVSTNPAIAVILNSREPRILAEKWMRFERYHHSDNRTAISCEADAISCLRRSLREPPTAAENILICGLLAGFLAMTGAKGIVVEIGGGQARAGDDFEVGRIDDRLTGAFRIAWTDFTPPGPDPSPAPAEPGSRTTAAASLAALLRTDIGRSWRLAEASRSLGKSPRSLQRDLASEGCGFATVMRGIRLDEAGRMLRETDARLAEIGYCCGYADQAHFQRDFRRAANMTPADFRRIAGA